MKPAILKPWPTGRCAPGPFDPGPRLRRVNTPAGAPPLPPPPAPPPPSPTPRNPGPMPLRRFWRAAQEGLDAGAVDELHGPAGPGRKTDAEDRADVGVGHAGEHAFGQAA